MQIVEEDLRDALDSVRTTQYKSFFIKKLEQHLKEQGVKIPHYIFSVFDTPFSDFGPEFEEIYETKIKGQALFQIFSDMLVEIYEDINADKAGWEAAANFLQDTPMKLCALYALEKIEELESMPEINYASVEGQPEGLQASPPRQKLNVKRYTHEDKSKSNRRKWRTS
jgi:hypothetical protein